MLILETHNSFVEILPQTKHLSIYPFAKPVHFTMYIKSIIMYTKYKNQNSYTTQKSEIYYTYTAIIINESTNKRFTLEVKNQRLNRNNCFTAQTILHLSLIYVCIIFMACQLDECLSFSKSSKHPTYFYTYETVHRNACDIFGVWFFFFLKTRCIRQKKTCCNVILRTYRYRQINNSNFLQKNRSQFNRWLKCL